MKINENQKEFDKLCVRAKEPSENWTNWYFYCQQHVTELYFMWNFQFFCLFKRKLERAPAKNMKIILTEWISKN